MNLYEQQATTNPNMPLRDLYYVVEELKKIVPLNSLYTTVKAKIPAPHFVVFYNGIAKQPERQTYKLSDLFYQKEKQPELELIVTVININKGCNTELLEKCESLKGYTTFVEKVRGKRAAEMELEDAVRQAVKECISENILSDFFEEYREEIVEVGMFEFNQELHDKTLFEDGAITGIRIYQELQKGTRDNMKIAEACGCTIEEVEKIRKQLNSQID